MTLRSDRRKAELAVIDAARLLMDETIYNDTTDKFEVPEREVSRLETAVLCLGNVPLETPGRARSNSLLVTSQNAAAFMNGKRANTVAGLILDALSGRYMTTDELVQHLDRPHQTVSARVNELRDAGWIRPLVGLTRKTRSGHEATVWKLTDEASRARLKYRSVTVL